VHSILAKKIGPEILGVSYTVDALLMTIIGGVGTFVGPVLGAAGLELLDTVFRDAEVIIGPVTIQIGERWALILGVIFVVVVLVFPYGIVGTWRRWRTPKAALHNPHSEKFADVVADEA
jgi:branched-chain amino acid transport system permease protein